MTVSVFITVDTEEDTWFARSVRDNPVENIARLPVLQRLLDRYGAIATYLINWPVATAESSAAVLADLSTRGGCEIGTHCHPWNTPPYGEELSTRNSLMSNLPAALVDSKLENLHRAITERFGRPPVCFRAGRWGFSPTVAACLQRLGYQVDTSISPFVDWRPYGGPDFSDGSTRAYRFDPADIFKPAADGALLEVPPTIGFWQRDFRRAQRFRKRIGTNGKLSRLRLLGILDRMRLLNFRWLSPELTSGPDMIRLADTFVAKGHRLLNMSFHSTSLLPSKSPFVKTEAQLQQFLAKIEGFLAYAVQKGMRFEPLCAATRIIGES